MNYAQIRKYDVANGEGVRTSIFFSGCTHRCKNCFNLKFQSFNYGSTWTKDIENDVIEHLKDVNISGCSILGGEPLQQDLYSLYEFLQRIKNETGKSVWLWTGYTYENIPKEYLPVLDLVDVLIDGKFEEDKKDLRLKWRGSSNQRIFKRIDGSLVNKTVDFS